MSSQNVMRRIEQDGRMTVGVHTASATLAYSDLNRLHTNRGAAGAVTLTLPAASGSGGRYVDVFVVADQNVVVAAASGEMVAHNNAAATSVAWSTSGDKIGSGARFICDGTSWLCLPNQDDAVTLTIA